MYSGTNARGHRLTEETVGAAASGNKITSRWWTVTCMRPLEGGLRWADAPMAAPKPRSYSYMLM